MESKRGSVLATCSPFCGTACISSSPATQQALSPARYEYIYSLCRDAVVVHNQGKTLANVVKIELDRSVAYLERIVIRWGADVAWEASWTVGGLADISRPVPWLATTQEVGSSWGFGTCMQGITRKGLLILLRGPLPDARDRGGKSKVCRRRSQRACVHGEASETT